MTGQPPWRRPPHGPFPGLPAWGSTVDQLDTEDFGVARLGPVTPAWAWGGADGSGVRVAILDSGVEDGNPHVGSLERSVEAMAGADGEIQVAESQSGDGAGHGTACASLIRAMAPGAALTSVRVLGSGRFGAGAALLAGLRWAIAEGYDVVNLSLSTAKDKFLPELRELADEAYFRRCVLVAAAHNMPIRSYPWPFASVISVASHDSTDPMVFYYNPAPPVDFYARGVRVPVAWTGGRTIRSTGNSFAAPHIAGLSALVLSKHPNLTPFQLKSVLYLTAQNVFRQPEENRHDCG